MPAWRDEWRLPDGHLAVVQRLDRTDLAALSRLIPDWMAGSDDDSECPGCDAGPHAWG